MAFMYMPKALVCLLSCGSWLIINEGLFRFNNLMWCTVTNLRIFILVTLRVFATTKVTIMSPWNYHP